MIFRSTSLPPSRSTGVAAPIVVPEAMAATCAAIVMRAPAEAARAPDGATWTTTGTFAPRKDWIMSRMEASSPPGVSSSIRNAWWASSCARASPSRMWSAITGVITPSTSVTSTVVAWARVPVAEAASQSATGKRSRPSAVRRPEWGAEIDVRGPGSIDAGLSEYRPPPPSYPEAVASAEALPGRPVPDADRRPRNSPTETPAVRMREPVRLGQQAVYLRFLPGLRHPLIRETSMSSPRLHSSLRVDQAFGHARAFEPPQLPRGRRQPARMGRDRLAP